MTTITEARGGLRAGALCTSSSIARGAVPGVCSLRVLRITPSVRSLAIARRPRCDVGVRIGVELVRAALRAAEFYGEGAAPNERREHTAPDAIATPAGSAERSAGRVGDDGVGRCGE
jgi:hypothetical protein